ncbi:histidine phosphatase superfamily [Schizophyllum commune]
MISASLLRVACLVVALSTSFALAERARFVSAADVCAREAGALCRDNTEPVLTHDFYGPSLPSRTASAISARAPLASLVHFPPNATKINDLDFVLNGSGAPGVYNSSQSPEYGVYNWCNMPHVRAGEYVTPPEDYKLKYVEVIHRHHKRTPYASNTFFKEDVEWQCEGEGVVHYIKRWWNAFTDDQNPWTSSVGPGFVGTNCQLPQITAEGLQDSYQHGVDLRSVYADIFGWNDTLDTETVKIRVTNNVITSQVAGGVLRGLFPGVSDVQVHVQPEGIDSLEPQYPCAAADDVRAAYTTGDNGTEWQDHLNATAPLFAKLDAVSGVEQEDDAGWHTWFDHYYDNLSAKQCHGKSLPCSVNDTALCVTQEEANEVYRLGNWEYSYLYRDAANSTLYSALKYGAWVLELRAHLEGAITGESTIVFELYEKSGEHFIRVLFGGQPLETSTPLGTLHLIPVEMFIDYIDSMLGSGSELYAACQG